MTLLVLLAAPAPAGFVPAWFLNLDDRLGYVVLLVLVFVFLVIFVVRFRRIGAADIEDAGFICGGFDRVHAVYFPMKSAEMLAHFTRKPAGIFAFQSGGSKTSSPFYQIESGNHAHHHAVLQHLRHALEVRGEAG